ncbi:MAG: DNA polymerase IV [Dehalococcoidales bacterium]|nr:DNA polymerase IV [Dehalococcoidales bacterium]
MANRTIMHIDLDAFFVSVEQVFQPELKGKPVVVGGKPDRRGVVAAASYEARAFGLHSGMPLATAVRLCPQAIFIEGNFQRYRDASEKFMAILADFSPFIEPMGIDEAYLDVTGFESLHGTIRQMALTIKQRVKNELGLAASIGIAPCKVVAKVASDYSKPDGLVEVRTGEEAAFLSPLPVGDLPGIGKQTELVLRRLGIKTIGEVARLSPSALKSRFGVFGEMLRCFASGIDNRRVLPPSAAKSISRATTFPKDTRDNIFLEATLRYLTERVGAELRGQSRQAKCVSMKLRYADFTTITRNKSLPQATDADQTIFEVGVELLKRALMADKQLVRLVGIGVSNLMEPGEQLAMFDNTVRRLERLNQAIDRIRLKYGFTAIQTGRTFHLKDLFPENDGVYTLTTPSLAR